MSMILTADRVITGDGKTVIEEGAVVLEGERQRRSAADMQGKPPA